MEMRNHLLFCYLSYMKGEIYRVTYNVGKEVAEIHLAGDSVKQIPMSQDEWNNNLKGDLIENFKKYLNE